MYYIITDPCYLISNDNWSKIFDPLDLEDPDFFPKAIKGITDELNKIGNCLGVAETGEGDWQNSINWSADYVEKIETEFFADAGLVCALEVGDIAELKVYGAAIVKSDVPLHCKMDQDNPRWTVVKLYNEKGDLAVVTEGHSCDEEEGYDWDEEESGWDYYGDEE